jgi:hypothetical protein
MLESSLYGWLQNGEWPRCRDLLAWGEPDIPLMEETFREICRIDCPEDALVFEPGSVQGSRIREDNPYQGVRMQVRGVDENHPLWEDALRAVGPTIGDLAWKHMEETVKSIKASPVRQESMED